MSDMPKVLEEADRYCSWCGLALDKDHPLTEEECYANADNVPLKDLPKLKTYIFTFGLGTELKNKYVKIEAQCEADARAIMVSYYGQMWAFCYDSEEAAGVQRFKLTEVALGTLNKRL